MKKVEMKNLEDPDPETSDNDAAEESKASMGIAEVPVPEAPESTTQASEESNRAKAESSGEDLLDKIAELTDNWQRERANFLNFKRRIEEEKREIRKYASYDLVYDLLRVIDYFESSVTFAENLPPDAQNVILGVEYTLKELKGILSAHGVTPIIIKQGDEFLSSLMEASERQTTSDYQTGTIVKVLREGWMYHDRVLRPSQVIVAVNPDEPHVGNSVSKGGENP
ncbi:MAG: nucleotide exchange factor GrpE [bacterium]|nr:nucleotide exchange factor GrpE [bacterium]